MTAYFRLALFCLLLSLPICLLGLVHFESNMEDVFQWLPDKSHERDTYDRFVQRFGSDDFVVVTWPGCDLADERADQFADAVRERDKLGFVSNAVSGRQLIRELGKQVRLRPRTVVSRYGGFYFGTSTGQTCVVVSFSKRGMVERGSAIAYVKSTAREVLGDTADQLVVGGYPELGVYGDEVIRWSMTHLVGPSCIVSTLIAWICLRNLRLTIATLLISGLAAALSISVVTLTGAQWGGLSSVIPTLAYIMSVSGGLHLINYSRSCRGNELALEVLKIGWRPCLFSAATTAVGMLSLCRSQFPAVRQFGLYCASGVVVSLICQLVLFPVALEIIHERRAWFAQRHWQDRLLAAVLSYDRYIVGGFLVLVVVFAVGLSRLHAELEVERAFSPDAPVMQDIAWLEKSLGPIEQTELVVAFPVNSKAGFSERIRVIRAVQAEIRDLPQVHGSLSLTDSLPDEPVGGGFRGTVARTAYRHALERVRKELTQSPYLSVTDREEAWRVSIRVPFLEHTNFSELARQVRATAESVLERESPRASASVEYTGVSHLYHIAQESVIDDLYRNLGLAFVLICPLMMVAVRSWRLGLLAMIPNICPTVLIFGGLGIVRYPVDIGIAMTASVALGIAVDDTTHFLLRYRDLQKEKESPTVALRQAFRQCSRAMLATTLIAGLGLSVFLWGPLVIMARFALVLIGLLTVALLCDLLLLPSLLSAFGFVSPNRSDAVVTRST